MANRKLNSIKFPDIADTYILDADKVNYSDSETYADGSVGKALQNKADNDGSYSNMTVGNAEQLVSNVKVNDKTPYLFRTSGGSVDIGDREYVNGVVGGTVAWNQLIANYGPNASTISSTSGVTTASGDGSKKYFGIVLRDAPSHNFVFKQGHRFFYTVKFTNIVVSNLAKIYFTSTTNGDVTNTQNAGVYSGIFTPNSDTAISLNATRTVDTVTTSADTFSIDYLNVIDLTQMFGSTIADYIYSLETANAGAGVAWFKKLFNKPYYAYNAGELKSVSGLISHDMTGFNQWDEVWEIGEISTTDGSNTSGSNIIRSKNYIPVFPNTAYYFKTGNTAVNTYRHFYDADKNYLGYVLANTNSVLTTPANAHYMRFRLGTAYGATYLNDICINISWDGSRNGEYEPYDKHSYPLDSDLTLRGIPKLDANNSLYYDGDMYEADGTVTRKYAETTTLSRGSADSSGKLYTIYTNANMASDVETHLLSNLFPCVTLSACRDNADNGIKSITALSGKIYIGGFVGSESALDAILPSLKVLYKTTPTTETADAYVGTQIVNDFGTEEYVISDNTFAVPVGHDTDYPINLVAKLEMAPNSPEGNGDYIVRQVNGENSYVPLVIEDALPTIPSTAGSYKLTVTVTEGSDPVLSWEAE